MLKNYFRIAFRNLVKHKTFSLINILGLTIGITGCILIAVFIYNELSYDRNAELSPRIYRMGLQIKQNGGQADYPDVDVAVGPGIKNIYPEVIACSRINGNNQMFFKVRGKTVQGIPYYLLRFQFLTTFFNPPSRRGCRNSPGFPEFHCDYQGDGG